MGRIEVVLDDELEQKLRMRALTQFGGRKGALVSAVTAAVQEYVNADVAANLSKALKDSKLPVKARRQAAQALARSGTFGVPALAAVLGSSDSDVTSRRLAAEELKWSAGSYAFESRPIDERIRLERSHAEAARLRRSPENEGESSRTSGPSAIPMPSGPSSASQPKGRTRREDENRDERETSGGSD